jgi:HlyD family secretion protein
MAGLGIYLALRPSSTNPSGSLPPSPTVAPSANTITALGRLEPEGEVVKVAAPSTSGSAVPVFGSPRVARLLVQERAQVKVGQPIAVLDVYDRLMAAALQSQAQVQEAQSRLAQVQAGARRGDIAAQQAIAESRRANVARVEALLNTAKWEAQRYQKLFRDGAVSEQEARNLQLKAEATARELDGAKSEFDEAVKKLTSVAEVRPTDVRQAQAEVNVAMAGIQRAKADLESAVVRSPITGQIIKVHAREGEQIGNDGLMEIGKTDRMYAVAEIYETDIQKVKRGQKAIITSPAFPGEISGVVDQIGLAIRKNDVLNTDPAANTDVRVVEVKIRLDDSQPVSGLTNLQVKVNITP